MGPGPLRRMSGPARECKWTCDNPTILATGRFGFGYPDDVLSKHPLISDAALAMPRWLQRVTNFTTIASVLRFPRALYAGNGMIQIPLSMSRLRACSSPFPMIPRAPHDTFLAHGRSYPATMCLRTATHASGRSCHPLTHITFVPPGGRRLSYSLSRTLSSAGPADAQLPFNKKVTPI